MKSRKKEIMFIFGPTAIIIFCFGLFLLYSNARVDAYKIQEDDVEASTPQRMDESQKQETADKVKKEVTDPINEDINKAVQAADETKDNVVK